MWKCYDGVGVTEKERLHSIQPQENSQRRGTNGNVKPVGIVSVRRREYCGVQKQAVLDKGLEG